MTSRWASRQLLLEAWVASLTLHGMLILAVLMTSQSKPLSLDETFQWNVSLVDMPGEPSIDSTVQAMPQPEVRPMHPEKAMTEVVASDIPSLRWNVVTEQSRAEEKGRPVPVQEQQEVVAQILPSSKEVAPVQELQRLNQASDAVVQSTPPVEGPSHHAQASAAKGAQVPVSPQGNEVPQSVEEEEITPRVVTPPPAQRLAPAVEARVESEPAQTSAVPTEPVGTLEPAEPLQTHAPLPTQLAALPSEATAPRMATEPDQPVTKAVQPPSAARADYGWLIDSIGKRLAELKRYPAAARLNGWEGKVVLRAVISADGNLTEVKVKKSSGYEELDAAAMEVLRQACPLSMRQALGRPDIVVNIPVVYALAQ